MYEITYLGKKIIDGGISPINFIREVLRLKNFNGEEGVYQNDLKQEFLITKVEKQWKKF